MIVCVSVFELLPFPGIAGLMILRLFRMLRIFKAARALPRLRAIIAALGGGLSSSCWVVVLMAILNYILACIGMMEFKANDPFHFGNLGKAMLSLYRIATLEDWCDIMYVNMFGCDGWGDYDGDASKGEKDCSHEAHPKFATTYFCSYVLVSAFLLLNLFIGVITNSVSETQAELYAEKKDAARLAMATRLRAKRDRQHQGKVGNPTYENGNTEEGDEEHE